MMRRVSLTLLAMLVLAGCGGSSTTTVTTSTARMDDGSSAVGFAQASPAQVAGQCPHQNPNGTDGGSMGCSIPPPQPGARLLHASAPRGSLFPDVSSWQGTVNWAAVIAWERAHGYKPAAIFKMGEYVVDPFAYRNAVVLGQLHAFRAGYWFVRNTGCAHEGAQIVAEARQLAIAVVELDVEVPEARGYDACLTPIVRRAGFIVNTYTSPGSWPGGAAGNATWIAAFGPAFAPGSPWGGKVIAWQFTDGRFGPVVPIPGIGTDDVNVDYGLLEQGAPPPDPYSIYPKLAFSFAGGHVHASEYVTVRTWDAARCRNPVKRAVCKSSHYHLQLLRDRVWFVAHHTPNLKHSVSKPRWGDYPGIPMGSRFAGMSTRLIQR